MLVLFYVCFLKDLITLFWIATVFLYKQRLKHLVTARSNFTIRKSPVF